MQENNHATDNRCGNYWGRVAVGDLQMQMQVLKEGSFVSDSLSGTTSKTPLLAAAPSWLLAIGVMDMLAHHRKRKSRRETNARHCGYPCIKTLLVACAAAITFASAPTSASPITYNVNDAAGPMSVVGSITTDGKLGALTSTDIFGWSFAVTDAYQHVFNITTGTQSQFILNGAGLVGSATQLTFDYNISGALLFFYDTSAGGEAFVRWRGTDEWHSGAMQLLLGLAGQAGHNDVSLRSGFGVIAEVPVPVPTPIAGVGLPGLIAAFGALVAFARRRRRQAAV